MAPILVSAAGYSFQKLDDEAFQHIFDELQDIELPLSQGSVEKLVNVLQPVCERSLEQQVSSIRALGLQYFFAFYLFSFY